MLIHQASSKVREAIVGEFRYSAEREGGTMKYPTLSSGLQFLPASQRSGQRGLSRVLDRQQFMEEEDKTARRLKPLP